MNDETASNFTLLTIILVGSLTFLFNLPLITLGTIVIVLFPISIALMGSSKDEKNE